MIYMLTTLFKKDCIYKEVEKLKNKNEALEPPILKENSTETKLKSKLKVNFMEGYIVKLKYILLELCTTFMIAILMVFNLSEGTHFR